MATTATAKANWYHSYNYNYVHKDNYDWGKPIDVPQVTSVQTYNKEATGGIEVEICRVAMAVLVIVIIAIVGNRRRNLVNNDSRRISA